MARRFIVFLLLLTSFSTVAGLFDTANKNQVISAEQAFIFDFRQTENQLSLNWQIMPGYYLYRQQIKLVPKDAQLAEVSLPQGTWHEDEFFGKTEIYRNNLNLPVTIQQATAGAMVSVTYQGCADAGVCYPPETREIPLSAVIGHVQPPATEQPLAAPSPSQAAPETESHGQPLPFSALWALLIGIGIAFTPCVLPMYPLISGIVLGGKQRLSTSRALLLAVTYTQGMALTYTALGLIVAAAGLQFQAALQHPAVLIGLSVMFVLLAASMFGLFSLQLPSSLQTRLTLISQRQQGGSLWGVLAMGALAGLICSPCTTAPLSAILLYIAQSGDIWLGGGTLYLYALGMGLPLILVTVFGNKLLPKSGPWMEHVKIAFGFVILALPVFLLERVIGSTWGDRLWSLLAFAFFSWAFIISLAARRPAANVLKIALFGAALIAIRPLQDWAFPPPVGSQQAEHLAFTPIANVSELQNALNEARGKRVMLDLYADWCVACKEFEKYTFSDPQVQNALSDVVLLQANVTQNTPEDRELLKYLQVLGLPTILFFDQQGQEALQLRVTGYMNAEQFSQQLDRLKP